MFSHIRTRFRLSTLLVGVGVVSIAFGTARFLLLPASTKVHGRVVYADGSPAAFIVVHAQWISGQPPRRSHYFPRWGRAFTDKDGYYTLRNMHAGKYNLFTMANGYTAQAVDSLACRGNTTAPELRLVRGAVIRGRVVDALTGQPVTYGGPLGVGLVGPSRPDTGAAVEWAPLQDDGAFTLRAAPGTNYIYLPWTDRYDPTSAQILAVDGQTIDVELRVSPGLLTNASSR